MFYRKEHGRSEARICAIDGSGKYCAADVYGTTDCVIFQVTDCFVPEVGDLLVHRDFAAVGPDVFCNETQGEDFEVAVLCSVNAIDWSWFRP